MWGGEGEYMKLQFSPWSASERMRQTQWGAGPTIQPTAPLHWGNKDAWLNRFIQSHPQCYERIHTIAAASTWLVANGRRLHSSLAANQNIADGWRAVIQRALSFFLNFDEELMETHQNTDPEYPKFRQRLSAFEQIAAF
jgi:hypothetical protein